MLFKPSTSSPNTVCCLFFLARTACLPKATSGQKTMVVDQLSGTRKLASLSGAPANWYRNYKLYHAGLVVRLHQTRSKQGSQTVGGLVEVARELSDVSMVVFALLFEDIIAQVLSPFNKNIQRSSMDPVVLWGHITSLRGRIAERLARIAELRRFVSIFALLTAYLTVADLSRWCQAYQYSQMGRQFPHVLQHLPEIIIKAEFQACKLQILQDTSSKEQCLHPRCQCAGQTGLGKKVVTRVRVRGQERRISVPEWVRRSPLTKNDGTEEHWFIPRFKFAPVEERPPLKLAGVTRFVRSANWCRCIAVKYLRLGL